MGRVSKIFKRLCFGNPPISKFLRLQCWFLLSPEMLLMNKLLWKPSEELRLHIQSSKGKTDSRRGCESPEADTPVMLREPEEILGRALDNHNLGTPS